MSVDWGMVGVVVLSLVALSFAIPAAAILHRTLLRWPSTHGNCRRKYCSRSGVVRVMPDEGDGVEYLCIQHAREIGLL